MTVLASCAEATVTNIIASTRTARHFLVIPTSTVYVSKYSRLRQCVNVQSTAGGLSNILLTALALIGHGVRAPIAVHFRNPEFLSRPRIYRPKSGIAGCADKHKPAG